MLFLELWLYEMHVNITQYHIQFMRLHGAINGILIIKIDMLQRV